MKTGGTALCAFLSAQPHLVEPRHTAAFGAIDFYGNCKLTGYEADALERAVGVRYGELALPSDGHVPLLGALLGRRVFFIEPAWALKGKMEWEWRQLPPFLADDSAAWRGAYAHVFLIREPLARAFSAIDEFRMPQECKLKGAAEFLRRYLDGSLPTQGDDNCTAVAAIATEQLGNFYIKHLTGRADALSLALRRLDGMHVLDLSGPDPACMHERTARVFGLAPGLEIKARRVHKGEHVVPQDEDLLRRLRMRMQLDVLLYEHVSARLQELCAAGAPAAGASSAADGTTSISVEHRL